MKKSSTLLINCLLLSFLVPNNNNSNLDIAPNAESLNAAMAVLDLVIRDKTSLLLIEKFTFLQAQLLSWN